MLGIGSAKVDPATDMVIADGSNQETPLRGYLANQGGSFDAIVDITDELTGSRAIVALAHMCRHRNWTFRIVI
jgi:hypothetical protein